MKRFLTICSALILLFTIFLFGCNKPEEIVPPSVLKPNYTWYSGETPKSTIKEIRIVNDYTPTGEEDETFVASIEGEINCYVSGEILIIHSKGKIFANEDSRYLFSGRESKDYFPHLTTITGLDKIDTSNVVNFFGAFDRCVSLSGELDLSSWNMQKVNNTMTMFQMAGQSAKTPLNIKLNDTLTVYDGFMFNHCASYPNKTFTIYKTVKRIGYMHVWYNFGTKVETTADNDVFNYLPQTSITVETPFFNEFIVEEGNEYFKAENGILYSINGERLIGVPGGKTFENRTFEIPEGVEHLNELCFSRTQQIDTLILPNSYNIIRYMCPEDYYMQTINYGNSLSIATYCYTTISRYEVKSDNPNYNAYNGCIYSKDYKELIAVPIQFKGELNIKEGTEIIGQEAFWVDGILDAKNITKIYIPESVNSIEENQLVALNKFLKKHNNAVEIDQNNKYYQIVENNIEKIVQQGK